jgi:NADH-quinone oxidoreductase subunit C
MSEKIQALAGLLSERLGERAVSLLVASGEITLVVSACDLLDAARELRDAPELAFDILIDVCGLDYLGYGEDQWKTEPATMSGFSRGVGRGDTGGEGRLNGGDAGVGPATPRFAVAYHLLSVVHNHRLRLKVYCEDPDFPRLDSMVDIWPSANWFEREAFDLFGILFEGHPDLRRLLTDYGFVGHPFRKDFPLTGHVEVRYDPERGRVVYEPVSIEPRTLVPRVIRDDARYADDQEG